MSKRLVGTYVSIDEAMVEVERLRDQGYGRNTIHVIADRSVRDSIPFTMDAEIEATDEVRKGELEGERSLWEKIKSAFTFNEYSEETYLDPTTDNPDDPLQEYRNDLAAGKVVILVEQDDDQFIPKKTLVDNDENVDRDPRNLP